MNGDFHFQMQNSSSLNARLYHIGPFTRLRGCKISGLRTVSCAHITSRL